MASCRLSSSRSVPTSISYGSAISSAGGGSAAFGKLSCRKLEVVYGLWNAEWGVDGWADDGKAWAELVKIVAQSPALRTLNIGQQLVQLIVEHGGTDVLVRHLDVLELPSDIWHFKASRHTIIDSM